eukprot:scaffold315060_cov22-Tisochrysis_lutea.AAC.2
MHWKTGKDALLTREHTLEERREREEEIKEISTFNPAEGTRHIDHHQQAQAHGNNIHLKEHQIAKQHALAVQKPFTQPTAYCLALTHSNTYHGAPAEGVPTILLPAQALDSGKEGSNFDYFGTFEQSISRNLLLCAMHSPAGIQSKT